MSDLPTSAPPALRLGVDLGGTKIEIIALNPAGQSVFRRRVPTPQGDYAATVAAVAGLVEAAERELGQHGSVGIGIPGAESAQTGLIKNANSTCLIGQPLRRDLENRLQRPIRIANDANRIAGEWGHNPLPCPEEEGGERPPCYCGRAGCVETWLSGPALAADHARQTGARRLPPAIVQRAEAGDAGCEATLQRYERRLAKALAQVINILDPDIIVLGGGLSNIDRLYANVPARWSPYVFSDAVSTRLCRNRHGDSSGVRGAAWLWNGESPI